MSLAALKKKTKSTKNIKIGFKKRINQSYSQTTNTDNSYIMKPNMSYYNIYKKYNNYKDSVSNGDCDVVVAIEPDLSGEHRVEVLSTQHLKKENMEKMKHIKREPNDRCDKKNELNYKDDDMSKTALSAQFVMNKKKACLIDGSFLDPIEKSILAIKQKLFFRIRGRGSILTRMRVEISVVIYDIITENPKTYILKSLDSEGNPITTDDQGEAIIEIQAVDGTYELEPSPQFGKIIILHEEIYANPNNRIIIKLKPTEESVDTDTQFVDNIIIRREYECTVNVENVQIADTQVISALFTAETQEVLNVNIDTTLVSKLVTENNNNPNYHKETIKDEIEQITGVRSNNLDIENFGQIYGIQQTSETLDEDQKKLEKSRAMIDNLEKKNSVVEEEINIISVLQEVQDSSVSIVEFNFSESSVITNTEIIDVLNEVQQITNTIIDSITDDSNKKELLNAVTISVNDNDSSQTIQSQFNIDEITNPETGDNVEEYFNLDSVLDVSGNIYTLDQ